MNAPIPCSRQLGRKNNRGSNTANTIKAIPVRRPISVKVAMDCPPGQSLPTAAFIQFFTSGNEKPQRKVTSTSMTVACAAEPRKGRTGASVAAGVVVGLDGLVVTPLLPRCSQVRKLFAVGRFSRTVRDGSGEPSYVPIP